MNDPRRPFGILLRAAMCLPGVLLGIFGAIHFTDGMAVDRAVPVPVYMIARRPMPKTAYVEAAKALRIADRRDGTATLARAEARMHMGDGGDAVIFEIREGLKHQPASARGWTILSEAQYPAHKQDAAKALSQAFILGPRDYWLAGARAEDAAEQWSALDGDTQALALAQARRLWQTPKLRGNLLLLARKPAGAALLTRAFGSDDIRAINRWIAHAQQQIQ